MKSDLQPVINRKRSISIGIVLIAVAIIGGCAKSAQQDATGKGAIRGINAIVTAPDLIFMIEERSIGTAGYKEAAGFVEYDDLTYNFNFDILLPGDTTTTRLATQFVDVVADTEYSLAITGTLANPSIIFWEMPERAWDGTETVFEADFVHLSPALGEVDVYFAPLGTAPVLGNAIATLGFGERFPYAEFADDDYELIITPTGDVDPLNFLYQSNALSSAPATRVTFAIFDTDPSITAGIAVNLINSSGGSANLPDANIPANVRLLHAALGTGRVDGYFDNDFNSIVFPDVGFGELSAYTDIDSVLTPITLTDVGNTGATVLEEDTIVGANSRHTLILGGAPGAVFFRDLIDEARPLESFPVLRLTNMSVNINSIDIYLLAPGTPITEDETPKFNGLPSLADSGFSGLEEGLYEMTLTPFGEINPISTPVSIDVSNGDFVDVVILDTADPAVVDLFFLASTVP